MTVIIVGAGISGLAAARYLADQGVPVQVLEKSRGVGGRMATRRQQGTLVDHGAQFFTCRTPAFETLLAPLLAQGVVVPWIDTVPTLTPKGIEAAPDHLKYPRLACPAGMNRIAQHLAEGLTIHRETKVLAVEQQEQWLIYTEGGQIFRGQGLLCTPPPAQSQGLVGAWVADWPQITFDPCFAVWAGYTTPLPEIPWGLRWQGDPVVAWSAVDSSKRLNAPCAVLMFHTTPDFARAHLELDRSIVQEKILAQAQARLDLPAPAWSEIHLWRYAQPQTSYAEPLIGVLGPLPLAVAGCWCAGGRVEGAYTSGLQAAQWLLQHL